MYILVTTTDGVKQAVDINIIRGVRQYAGEDGYTYGSLLLTEFVPGAHEKKRYEFIGCPASIELDTLSSIEALTDKLNNLVKRQQT